MMLSLGLRLRLIQECSICEQSVEDHAPSCPYTRLQLLTDKCPEIRCPQKCRGKVDLNADDFYECRRCHTQFSRSQLVDREDAQHLHLLDMKHDNSIFVQVIEAKGKGHFPLDQQIKAIEAEIKQIKKDKRKR